RRERKRRYSLPDHGRVAGRPAIPHHPTTNRQRRRRRRARCDHRRPQLARGVEGANLDASMSVPPGTRIGAYEVVAPLRAGGMGEVYRARDTKLGRDVALKILPATFASDPDRLARFEREARTLASLNHASIAQIYGVEEADDIGPGRCRAIVMELVDGE